VEKWGSDLDLTPAFVRENQELFVADGARSDEEEAVLQNLRQPARIEMVIPAVEAEPSVEISSPAVAARSAVAAAVSTANFAVQALLSHAIISHHKRLMINESALRILFASRPLQGQATETEVLASTISSPFEQLFDESAGSDGAVTFLFGGSRSSAATRGCL